MTVTRLAESHQSQYSKFVAANSSGSFLQSWSWGDFQTEQYNKVAVRYGVFDNETLIATVQLFQTKIPKLPGSYLYSPYGPLVATELLNSEEIIREIISALLGKIKADFAKAWFIRFEPKDDLPIDGKPSVHIQPGSTLITDLSVSEEELLAGMHTKTRYNIKVAAKHSITTKRNLTNKDAIALLTGTSKRQGYKSHAAAYYEQLLSYFEGKDNADCSLQLYEAFEGETCIASAIMVDHGTTRTYLFGGSDNSKRNLMAPYALHWQAIRDAKAAGKTTYDWWGTETATGATPGFVQFKLRWGGTQKFYAGARDIVLNSAWYFAYSALRKVNRLI